MDEKLAAYRRADAPLPDHNTIWPLYGAGFENLGKDGKVIDVPMPEIGPDELLVRHDACGICFSDIKIMTLGQDHPRIYRNMQEKPVVMGHEVSMTVVKVGENLRDHYKVGDRFIIQADIYVDGVGYAYGYEIDGGFSKYGKIDQRILNGDEGNYLMPIQDKTGYAESALTEPWACVIAAYRLQYRTILKAGGTLWIIGTSPEDSKPYTISAGFDENSHPARLFLTRVPAAFAKWLRERARQLGIDVIHVDDISNLPSGKVDDIVLLGADPAMIEAASPYLANFGVFAIMGDKPMERGVQIDIGRVHYNRWLYVGSTSPDIACAYSDTPVRSELKAGGRVWFIGAAGPMGRMHVQRAIQMANGPQQIVCTDVSDHRLADLYDSFADEAQAKGIEFVCFNPASADAAAKLETYKQQGFDDIVVLAPVPKLVTEAEAYLATGGVMNIFAGVARGTVAELNMSDVYLKNVRHIGQSGSLIEDMRITLNQAESGELSPNRAVAALGSLSAFRDGLKAVQDAVFPGKVVIFPQIKELPLTPLTELKDKLPSVYAKLKDGREWTNEAEEEFLRLMLP